jgi:hypothetical protein
VKSVEFHPEAESEFIAAARYYEGHAENLGLDFIADRAAGSLAPERGAAQAC